uniref:Dot/Icm T4SS effector n=1 Tax=Strongyloides venezuelensis TaxID=75913 RepID=A0A0K0FI07_STRVS
MIYNITNDNLKSFIKELEQEYILLLGQLTYPGYTADHAKLVRHGQEVFDLLYALKFIKNDGPASDDSIDMHASSYLERFNPKSGKSIEPWIKQLERQLGEIVKQISLSISKDALLNIPISQLTKPFITSRNNFRSYEELFAEIDTSNRLLNSSIAITSNDSDIVAQLDETNRMIKHLLEMQNYSVNKITLDDKGKRMKANVMELTDEETNTIPPQTFNDLGKSAIVNHMSDKTVFDVKPKNPKFPKESKM